MSPLRRSPLVYEINTRCWLDELSRQARSPVTLGCIPEDQFSMWARLGFTHIWLMGVWECGPLLENTNDADTAPSPYAVLDYKVPDALGGNTGLPRFRERLHQHGLKLILDFVPNHTSRAHRWVKERPDFYVRSPRAAPGFFRSGANWIAHGKDPYFPPWNDTAQLGHRNREMREALVGELLKVAEQCDGARCDMSMLILSDVFANTWKQFPSGQESPTREFWSEAIESVRRLHPEFLFLAEAYWDLEPRLLDLGFDYAYDKRIYDHLIARNSQGLKDHLASKSPQFLSRTCHFLENHDERRIASVLNFEEHRAASLLTLVLPGMRLIHEGQLSGATIRASVHRRSRPEEAVQPEIGEWYERLLLALKGSGPGREFESLPSPNGVIAMRWETEPRSFHVAVVNLASWRRHFEMELPPGRWEISEVLNANTLTGNAERRFTTELAAHGVGLWRLRLES